MAAVQRQLTNALLHMTKIYLSEISHVMGLRQPVYIDITRLFTQLREPVIICSVSSYGTQSLGYLKISAI